MRGRSPRRGIGVVGLVLVAVASLAGPALGLGVGDATWTPDRSTTSVTPSRFLDTADALTFQTVATWGPEQSEALAAYLGNGLRYTHEVNDHSGRLSATGFWATNHPDPAFDRDDDDGDGRWEEAEIIAGRAPLAGQDYTTLVQFSRWHAKRKHGACRWAWDRRSGDAVVYSQLSGAWLGEWQAERYTRAYDRTDYARVDARTADPGEAPSARCRDALARPGESGVTVTFGQPLPWSEFLALPGVGTGRWTAFEAVGRIEGDGLPWTCGGPVDVDLGLRPCRGFGVRPDGVVAAVGYFDGAGLDALRATPQVARISDLRDPLTGLLFDLGALGVVAPGLTVNDGYWELASPGG
jgi:hypothetical protein